MAEGFANRYGGDILTASSAGLAPTQQIPPETIEAMNELNIDMSLHVPRRYDPFEAMECDLIVNMAGFKLPGPAPRELLEWTVPDPYGAQVAAYRVVRDDLEQRVMRLILDLRRRARNGG